MDSYYQRHMDRLRVGLLQTAQYQSYAKWITANTMLRGEPFSFVDHEYQEVLARDRSQEINVIKCAQIGISEFSVRRALAILQLHVGTTVLYSLPTATFASTFVKTRIDPVIEGSHSLRDSIHPGVDSAMVKRFTNDSFLYARGASGTGQAISVPVDFLVNDEVDFSDQGILDTFTSRLTHSVHKGRFRLSTPTIPGYGIADHYDHSLQKVELVKCNHCNHWFWPEYHKHVRLPGFKGDSLKEITRGSLAGLNLDDAYVECPKCGLAPSFELEYREWVTKNPDSGFDAIGYHITPFCAPNVITPGYLIKSSTSYDREADFVNFGLGCAMQDSESSLSRDELLSCFLAGEAPSAPTAIMGIDMGGMCAIHIGIMDADSILIVHSELCPLSQIETRRLELKAKYRVIMEVVDGLPYTDLVMRFQRNDPNCWASIFTNTKGLGVWAIRQQDEDPEKATADLRQVNVHRNKGLDTVMELIRGNRIHFIDSAQKENIISHLTDMKRVKQFTSDNELEFVWVKSKKGVDHYFFALLYLYLASKLRGLASVAVKLPYLVNSFRRKEAAGARIGRASTSPNMDLTKLTRRPMA